MTPHECPSQLVAVGIGNTSVQAGFYRDPKHQPIPIPESHISFSSHGDEWDRLRTALPDDFDPATPWYLVSVFDRGTDQVVQWVEDHFPDAPVHVLRNQDFPITISVLEPDKIGGDRVASTAAANLLRQAEQAAPRPAIVIDAGTAITVNAISSNGELLGGAILSGTTTSAKGLAANTDKLPEVEVRADHSTPRIIGRDTTEAIRSGVYWGTIGAVRELTARFREEVDGEPAVFVTGGFGPALAEQLGEGVQYVPHLVLSGVCVTVAKQSLPRS